MKSRVCAYAGRSGAVDRQRCDHHAPLNAFNSWPLKSNTIPTELQFKLLICRRSVVSSWRGNRCHLVVGFLRWGRRSNGTQWDPIGTDGTQLYVCCGSCWWSFDWYLCGTLPLDPQWIGNICTTVIIIIVIVIVIVIGCIYGDMQIRIKSPSTNLQSIYVELIRILMKFNQ